MVHGVQREISQTVSRATDLPGRTHRFNLTLAHSLTVQCCLLARSFVRLLARSLIQGLFHPSCSRFNAHFLSLTRAVCAESCSGIEKS